MWVIGKGQHEKLGGLAAILDDPTAMDTHTQAVKLERGHAIDCRLPVLQGHQIRPPLGFDVEPTVVQIRPINYTQRGQVGWLIAQKLD